MIEQTISSVKTERLAMNIKQKQFVFFGVIGIALYLLSTGISYGLFSTFGKKEIKTIAPTTLTVPSQKPQRHFTSDPSVPKDQACPINGEMYTKKEKEIWDKRRPLAVMIENHEEARPQSGISFADVVYDSVAEGGISRFMAVFYCGLSTGNVLIAPVRSARTYFLPWVLEYDALYNHVGGAGNCSDDTVDERAKALCQIDQWRIKDLDQFGISFPTCYRNYDRLDHPVATEHTMVCQTDKLFKLASDRGWTNVDSKGVAWDKKFEPWKFKDDAKEADRGTTNSISFVAWKGYEKDYGVEWVYDKASNSYKRNNGGKPHTDLETEEQLTAKAVVIVFVKEIGPVDDHMHLLYNNIGSGSGLLFQDGKAEKITWAKEDRAARTKFMNASGKEIQLTRGQVWIHMLPTGTTVTY
ncbi:MAG: hypothetical protein UW37_C0014G0014 [Candidatus Gottesmanbacteria bacterium GW2011_GWA2_44_17]|uniref:DUF3048 domain-containing protein n=3 Tax=Candidatus Gottesmaniibacteriota TaxID=1752720 RepID=A0A0G1IN50_9BACT|nr:MAG: hypothetical protein UV63_C0038G0020 [Microgenomates group bacterium GW2011_GWC1_43_11]KKT38711.1 MAG: hypothetical protein UW22_C0007G0014 [Candidatus Gottesmanbacteria bacterium GW2011_GWB1_44_11c]KKT47032.1 MAG: hypothetical protein UW37_C0014G0014 [Candidatus Gottesmanbacteria bacterium GW2011_GWA2_44_17]KKT60575.1 MAG: hypothetical protein UW52_C0023G0018 [Candidatus Gottesmanbacteria bacterium GW2011_GWA1_44_24b]HCM82605.1 hypothetical protein [Patescibacteria group bacterium]